ncbi:hypothetical protein FZC66_08485 [Priestia megaterium]|nr:hypothetical protein FZC66_08485 [Priestia megaterium]
MTSIKLNYEDVIKKLEAVEKAVGQLSMSELSDLGKNALSTTSKWKEREKEVHTLVTTYTNALEKNVQDTKANVDLLKEQDEAMARS